MECYKMDRIERDHYGFAVRFNVIEETQRFYWMDVEIDKWGDVVCEWNQYIFRTKPAYDPMVKEDLARMAFQDDPDNYDELSSAAIGALEDFGHIRRNDDGTYTRID